MPGTPGTAGDRLRPFGLDSQPAERSVSSAPGLPLFPGGASKPPPNPAIQVVQIRPPFAETEVLDPAPKVPDQLFDHPVQADAPVADRPQPGHPPGPDDRRVGPVPSGLDPVLRFLRKADGSARPGWLDSAAASMRRLETVEDRAPTIPSAPPAGSQGRTGEGDRRQFPGSLAYEP